MPLWPKHLLRWKPPTPRNSGTVVVLPAIHSPELDNSRDVRVYLPAGYGDGQRRYPVLYMQDGQNLFDAAMSFAGSWRVDEAMESAARKGHDAIIVAIPHMEVDRIAEYDPFTEVDPPGRGEQYLQFIVETLKPLIDSEFRTRATALHTGLAGSSMGGLISLAGFFRYPRVFGVVAALSPSLWYKGRGIFPLVEAAPFVRGRIYLDMGTFESPHGVADARRMRDVLVKKGYRLDESLKFVVERRGRHSEEAWGRRFRRALPYLLSGRRQSARRRSNA
jgi:predicted alpha/beta superfamily hydrolase